MNKKELFMSVLRNERPLKWMGNAYDPFPPFYPMVVDPITVLDSGFTGNYVDHWGATWRHFPEDPGAIPLVTDENKVIKDICHWRDYLKFPGFDGLDWGPAQEKIAGMDRENMFVMIPSYYGPFERAHALMTFEDVLIYMQTEPETMYELFGALTDWKIEAMRHVIDNLRPDIIHSHDDWGSRYSLFFSPEMFRQLLKPHYKRLCDYIHSRGVMVQWHSDGFVQGLENDILEMGADMLQGVTPQNDIVQMFRNTNGKLPMIGGIDQALIDRPGASEAAIRAECRRAINDYAAAGPFLPGVCSVLCITPGIDPIIIDELNSYGAAYVASLKNTVFC